MALTYEFNVKDNGSATFNRINNTLNLTQQNLMLVDKRSVTFNKSLTQLNNTTNIVGKSLGMAATSVANFGGILLSQGVAKLKDLTKEMVDTYDSAAKLSQNLGITADSVLGLRHAAELSHVGSEAMDKNMQKLSKTMFDAASGNKAAGKSFEQLGISVTNSDGSLKKSDAVLMELADKFKALPPGTEKAAAAMDIFGKSGASMVSMLKDGSGALKKMVDEGAGAAGNVQSISEAMEKLNDAGTRAKAALMGMLAGIVDSAPFKAMVSGFNSMSEALIKWNKESKDKAKQEREANEVLMAQLKAKEAIIKYKETENSNDKINLDNIKKQIAATQQKLNLDRDAMDLITAQANASVLLAKAEENNGRLRSNEIEDLKKYGKQIEAIEKKRADLSKASILSPTVPKDDSAAKAYEAEIKRLQDWLVNYQNAKRTEREIAEDNHKKATEELTKALAEDLIKVKDYNHEIWMLDIKLQDDLKELDKKYQDEKLKAAEEAKNKEWDLRRIAAKDYSAIADIELEQIEAKYAKEIKLAEKANEDTKLLKQAHQAEIEALNEKVAESTMQQHDKILSYYEAAAQTEEQRMAVQMDRMNAKYDAELAKAGQTAEMIKAIEAAKNAEIMRMEEQLAQMRLAQSQQYMDSMFQVANAAAVLGKAGGNTQKGIAMSQATINTALAATKAATAAPFPLNAALVAGAIAQGAVQLKTISAQKFASGGMIPGSNTLIMANEQGREAILNPMAVRAVGGEAGVNALNRGTSNTYNNSRSNTVNINVSTSIMTQKTYRDEIEPVLRRAERRR